MARSWQQFICTCAAGALTIGGFGCTAGLNGNTTLADALQQLAGSAQTIPGLNQLTIADLVSGFEAFASNLRNGVANGLSEEQIASLEDLQNQLDSGAINEDDFASNVEELIGSDHPFADFGGPGFFGGPFGHGHGRGHFLINLLDLTEAQQTQADAIFESLHDDIHAMREAAHDEILALLTEEQRAMLEDFRDGRHDRWSDGADDASDDADDGKSADQASGRGRGRGPGHPGGPFGFGRPGFGVLIDLLELTEEQQTQIAAIRTALRTNVANRHQQARDEFRAILTPEQIAILDEFKAAHDHDDSDDADSANDDSTE